MVPTIVAPGVWATSGPRNVANKKTTALASSGGRERKPAGLRSVSGYLIRFAVSWSRNGRPANGLSGKQAGVQALVAFVKAQR